MSIRFEDLIYGLMLPSGNDAAWCIGENMGCYLHLLQKATDEGTEKQEEIKAVLYNGGLMQQSIESIRFPLGCFLREMNKMGKLLNLQQTNYANPHGLMFKENKSCAHDVGRLCCHAIKLPLFAKVVSTKTHTAQIKNKEGYYIAKTWINTNKLLWKGWDGIKTGITDSAGPCLASALTLNENGKEGTLKKQYVVIVLNCQSMDIRWEECE